jgi:hypothetical protein
MAETHLQVSRRRFDLRYDLVSNLVYRAYDFHLAYLVLSRELERTLAENHKRNAAKAAKGAPLAFRLSKGQPAPQWPRYFLLSHTIELALKAFLAIHGKTAKELRKDFGHDLIRLLKEAIKCGLVVGDKVRGDIALLENVHNNHWARYPTDDNEKHYITPLVGVEEFEKTASELLEQVGKALEAL